MEEHRIREEAKKRNLIFIFFQFILFVFKHCCPGTDQHNLGKRCFLKLTLSKILPRYLSHLRCNIYKKK